MKKIASSMTQDFIFLKALAVHSNRLQNLLGQDWDAFQKQMKPLLEKLLESENGDQASARVSDILKRCTQWKGDVEHLVNSLFEQSYVEANGLNPKKDFVLITDPTTGETSKVDVKQLTNIKQFTFGGEGLPPANYDDVIKAGRILARAILQLAEAPVNESVSKANGSGEERRYFNTFFLDLGDDKAIPPEQPLVWNQFYTLYIDISPECKGLGNFEAAFPDWVVKEEWNTQPTLPITVWVASRDFAIDPQQCTLLLPRTGPSAGVKVFVQPLLKDDWGKIHVELFYKGYLLQAKVIEARIVPEVGLSAPGAKQPVQSAKFTFTTVDQFSPENLDPLRQQQQQRVLTVNAARDSRDFSVDLRFMDRTNGDEEAAYYDTNLEPTALKVAISAVRQTLENAVSDKDENGHPVPGYQWGIEGDNDLICYWLPRLATVGRNLYRYLLPKGGKTFSAQGLEPGTIIQVNPILGTVTIPWALLYERKVLYEANKTKVCQEFAACGPYCSHCPSLTDPYVICPYAFWGYRYVTEQLPCWINDELQKLPTQIRKISNDPCLNLNFNINNTLKNGACHKADIEKAPNVKILLADNRSAMGDVWKNHGNVLDVIYFFCHGGKNAYGDPYLKLSDNQYIDSNFLENVDADWPHSPIVFLNGCATGDYGPESYVSLIDYFRRAGASGVIGTECSVPQDFAKVYAEKLFYLLFSGITLGQAMLDVRLELLRQKKNPLGLIYTLYAAQELGLAQQLPIN